MPDSYYYDVLVVLFSGVPDSSCSGGVPVSLYLCGVPDSTGSCSGGVPVSIYLCGVPDSSGSIGVSDSLI